MKILLDTNIVLDLALIRQPFYDEADQIFALVEQQKIQAYLSGSAISDLYYILKKQNGKEWTLQFLAKLVHICFISPVNDQVIKQALAHHYRDLEDDIQYYAAFLSDLTGIVTRNTKDYPPTSLQILTPTQLLNFFP